MIAEYSDPWIATLSESQYLLVSFFLSAAGLALFSAFIRAWLTRNEEGPRYRTTAISRLGAVGIAFLNYAGMVAQSRLGYDLVDGEYVPNGAAIDAFALHYLGWSVAVPLVGVALVAVCALVGAGSRLTTFLVCITTFLAVLSAYIGAFAIDNVNNPEIVQLWGLVSLVFFFAANAIVIWAVLQSKKSLTTAAYRLLRQALILLIATWSIYPIVYFLQICTTGGGWATGIQVVYCLTDVAVLVIVGELIHRVAKLRTAEDVRAGIDVHPEAIWISSIKMSDAGRPAEVYLDQSAIVHDRRPKPPIASAVATDADEYGAEPEDEAEFIADVERP